MPDKAAVHQYKAGSGWPAAKGANFTKKSQSPHAHSDNDGNSFLRPDLPGQEEPSSSMERDASKGESKSEWAVPPRGPLGAGSAHRRGQARCPRVACSYNFGSPSTCFVNIHFLSPASQDVKTPSQIRTMIPHSPSEPALGEEPSCWPSSPEALALGPFSGACAGSGGCRLHSFSFFPF